MSHRDSEARRSEGVESSITLQSIWPRESGVYCRCAEPYQSWGRVAANAYADPPFICVARTFKVTQGRVLYKFCKSTQEANQLSMCVCVNCVSMLLFRLVGCITKPVGLALFMLTLWLQGQPALARDAMNHYMIILHHYEVVVYKYRG